MDDNICIASLLLASDPLSERATNYLLAFREEDTLIDFKVTFNPDSEKEWLELVKDVMAFANTKGGYLVFGVENGTFLPVGLDKSVASQLADTNKVMQKINRFMEPEIIGLRSKLFEKEGKLFSILFIPESTGITHMVSKDGFFKFPSGERKTILQQGTFYVRRSGGNHLVDPRDLEDIINKRLDLFKESILGKIAKVVEAPRDSEVFIVPQEPGGDAQYRFIISNAPGSTPVKGMAFTVPPQTPEQEVAAWMAMRKKEPLTIVPPSTLWRLYKLRHSLKLTDEQRLAIAEISMLSGVPFFFWLRGIPAENIKRFLTEAITRGLSLDCVECVIGTAAFLGKTFHKTVVERINKKRPLSPKLKRFPEPSPREILHAGIFDNRRQKLYKNVPEEQFRAQLEKEIDTIAESLKTQNRLPGVLERADALAIDCYLYAQEDRFEKEQR